MLAFFEDPFTSNNGGIIQGVATNTVNIIPTVYQSGGDGIAGKSTAAIYPPAVMDWNGIATNATSTVFVAVVNGGDIWTYDSNGPWTNRTTGTLASNLYWNSVASDASGQKLVAVETSSGTGIWTSIDFGETWVQRYSNPPSPPESFVSVASSIDGTHLVVAALYQDIFTSTDSGITWVNQTTGYPESGSQWESVASDSTGQYLVAVAYTGDIWTSNNYGIAGSWVNQTTSTPASGQLWVAVTSDYTGKYLAAVAENQDIWTSTDYGITWINKTASTSLSGLTWGSIASDYSGANLVASVYQGDIWTSANYGNSWVNKTNGTAITGQNWYSVTSDSTGTNLAIVSSPGEIWFSHTSGNSWIQTTGPIVYPLSNLFSSASANFTPYDINHQLLLTTSFNHTGGLYNIIDVLSPNSVLLDTTVGGYVNFQYTVGVQWSLQSYANVEQISMWAPDCLIDNMFLANNFGSLIDTFQPSSETYKLLIQGVFQYFMLGPAITRMEAALNVINGFPVAQSDDEVALSYVNGILTTNLNVYGPFSSSMPLRPDIEAAVTATPPQPFPLQAFEPLSSAFTVEDQYTNPTWWWT